MILVLLALAAPPRPSSPASPPVTTIDLATLQPGTVHKIGVAAETPFSFRLVNLVPGGSYRYGWGRPPHDLVPRAPQEENSVGFQAWGVNPDCEDLVPVVRELFSAKDEAGVGALFAPGGRVSTALSGSACRRIEQVRRDVDLLTTCCGGGLSLKLGEWMEVVAERVDSSASSASRTWTVRFEATTEPSYGWPYANEITWLASEIASDLDEMAARVADHKASSSAPRIEASADGSSLRVTLPGGRAPGRTRSLELGDSVWSPSAWEPIAASLLAGAQASGGASDGDRPTIETLTDPQALILERENQRLSRWLSRDLRSPQAHEQAALLLAAFALREAAGPFSEVRPTLCRLTAHLAFARSLRGQRGPSRDGTWADIARLVLLNRQADAVAAMNQQGASSAAERAWANALRLRATGDWRILDKPLLATLLERREWFRALCRSLGSEHALAQRDRRNVEPIVDWGRIALNVNYSVGTGNRLLPQVVDMEVAEAVAVYRAMFGAEPKVGHLQDRLGDRPGRCLSAGSPRVIDWGAWAGAYQRHIVNGFLEKYDQLRFDLALPDQADAYWARAREAWRGLELLAWVAVHDASSRAKDRRTLQPDPAALDEQCGAALTKVSSHPERFGAGAWEMVWNACSRWRQAAPLAGMHVWFGSTLPRGTAFEYGARKWIVVSKSTEPERLGKLAPWDKRIADDRYFLRSAEGGLTMLLAAGAQTSDARDLNRVLEGREGLEILDSVYGSLVEYNLDLMKKRASFLKRDPESYRKKYAEIVEADPDSGLDLGAYLAGRGMDDAAATAFQKAVDDGLNPVRVSNQVDWLVEHYLDREDRASAERVARWAGRVGSDAGLGVLARYYERTGRCGEAERTLKERANRYPGSVNPELSCLYLRCVDDSGDPRFGRETQEPRGAGLRLPLVAIGSLTGPPSAGVVVKESAPIFEERGLAKGDTIVAIDGRRVRGLSDYQCARTLGPGLEATAIVWDGRAYKEITAPLRRPHPALTFDISKERFLP